MNRNFDIAANAWAVGFHSFGVLVGSGANVPPLAAVCAAALVYHAIVLRRLLREGAEL